MYTCAAKSDDCYRDKSDAVRRRGRKRVFCDVTASDEQQNEEWQNVAERDAYTQAEFLD